MKYNLQCNIPPKTGNSGISGGKDCIYQRFHRKIRLKLPPLIVKKLIQVVKMQFSYTYQMLQIHAATSKSLNINGDVGKTKLLK